MSLTVTCTSCRDPENPRLIVQWPQSCADCAGDFVARHISEHPGHNIEITGSSPVPFGVSESIRKLFGRDVFTTPRRNGW